MARAFCPTRWRAAPAPCWRGRTWPAMPRRWAWRSSPTKIRGCRLARMAAAFYGAQPDIVAAVTGTKGKSSIVAFLREIWTRLGKPAASLGTVGVVGPKGETPLQPHHPGSGGNPPSAGGAQARRRRASRHRGLQPWPGSISAGRRGGVGRGFHQPHPRSYGLPRHLRGLPRRQAAAVHRNGGGWRRGGGQQRCRAFRRLHRGGEEARSQTC